MDPQAPGPAAVAAPPVVAVVVTRNPGDWLDEAMGSLAAQTYPNLSVLVIDAASDGDITPRIARVMPTAYVRRLDTNAGFGAAANEVLQVVEGAAFYLFCHDDVALAPDALRIMVEEAFRSNAAVVGPKLVQWDDPRRLLQVGEAVDKLGVTAPIVERGELDQEQHDAVRDVFCVPGGCTLVRADLFAAVGGFDPGINYLHDDLSLCWRTHLAGARVLVAPAARVRHLEALGLRRPVDDRRRLQARHRLRIILSCYSLFHLLRVLPQAAVLALGETLYALLVGRRGQASDIAGAWRWNFSRLSEVRAIRAHVKSFRQVGDPEVRRLQTRGSARVLLFLRGQIGRGDDRLAAVARSGRELAGSFRSASVRTTATVWIAVLAVLLVGSRGLITGGVPAVGELLRFDGATDLLREWTSGWRSVGLGSESPAPTALGAFGVLGLVMFGAVQLLRTVLIVGLLPLGVWGAHRLVRPFGSQRARLVALLVYAAVPLPYNALSSGRWGALALWAAAPWMLGRLARASGLAPFGDRDGRAGPGVRRLSMQQHVLAVGVVAALAAMLTPAAALMVVVVAAAFVLGTLISGHVAGIVRLLIAGTAGAVVAAVLHAPWTLDFLTPGAEWASVVGAGRRDGEGALGTLLRFETGPIGAEPVGYVFLVAAALPLLIGRDWRFSWAVRGWTVAVVCWGLAWVGQHGWGPELPHPDVLLAPAAAGLALAAALGMVAFEVDLPGYRFGWRQIASGLSVLAVLAGTVPVLGAALDGRWSLPKGDFERAMRFVDDDESEGGFRVLWIGDPAVLPLGSWQLAPGVAYATSDDGTPRISDLWPGTDDGPTALLTDALSIASRHETARLGRMLAPMGVRYVVVVERLAPAPFATEDRPVPERVRSTLAEQLDLERIDAPAGLTVYRNRVPAPMRGAVDPSLPLSGGLASALGADLGARPVLPDDEGYSHWSGPLDGGDRVLLSAGASPGWQLEVEGRRAERSKALGWANVFDVPVGGGGSLRFHTPWSRYGVLLLQAVLWLLVARSLLRMRLGPEVGER